MVVTLGFRDDRATPARTVLLLLDGRTHALQAVRELVGDATQTTARDLWRVDKEETLTAVPTVLPKQDERAAIKSDEVIDPACPGLERDYVLSVRRLATMPYVQLPLPTPLPSNVVKAALINPASTSTNTLFGSNNVQLVLRSAGGWLRLRVNGGPVSSTGGTNVVQRGAWTVQFAVDNTGSAPVAATVQRSNDGDPSSSVPYAGLMLSIDASGWTHEQVLDVVDRLQFPDVHTWPTLAPQCLDPHPLPADVERVLAGAQQALATLPNGTFHVTMNVSAHTQPQQPERTDPYHIPTSITAPTAWTVEQWATMRDGKASPFKQVSTGKDGTLLNASVATPSQYRWYEARAQTALQSTQQSFNPYSFRNSEQVLGVDLARPLLAWDTPITMTVDNDLWRFEQVIPGNAQELVNSGFWTALIANSALVSYAPMNDLPRGTIVQRVWLDQAQLLPRRWEVIHRGPSGAETMIHAIDVRPWSTLAAPEESFWTLPPLPPDTVLATFDAPNTSVPNDPGTLSVSQRRALPTTIDTVGGPISLTPPKQALVWQPESGLTINNDMPYHSPATVPAQGPGGLLESLLYSNDPNGI